MALSDQKKQRKRERRLAKRKRQLIEKEAKRERNWEQLCEREQRKREKKAEEMNAAAEATGSLVRVDPKTGQTKIVMPSHKGEDVP